MKTNDQVKLMLAMHISSLLLQLMALNPRPQSCEKNMSPKEGGAKSPYKPSQVQINVQPSGADKIPVTTNETMAYLESENETTPPDNQTGPVEFDESDAEMNNILSDQKSSDNPALPMITPSGKPTPTIIPQTRESNSCWDGSHLTSVTREKILIREPSLQMMNIKSSTSKTREELKEILEKQLEETRSKNLSHYADILKSTERWRSSSRDMEQTSTTITSKWLDPLRDPEEPRPFGEDIHLTGSLSDSLEEQLEHERELIKVSCGADSSFNFV
ncbi:hypothetical protein FGIG_11709 [Fasciola gigantica]|uniref:Uncharacterized protein n=1 Tax=Fasciola gigantica TaxID=46835 RepID=A0A504YUX6_FASGI|nr:hypothetical protein FGIG_11709 [Fasciola gigantica]